MFGKQREKLNTGEKIVPVNITDENILYKIFKGIRDIWRAGDVKLDVKVPNDNATYSMTVHTASVLAIALIARSAWKFISVKIIKNDY
jgi:hypothetical protein